MECLISKGDGEASSTSLLNNTTDMERKITAKDAEKFLKTLVKDKWLDEVVSTKCKLAKLIFYWKHVAATPAI